MKIDGKTPFNDCIQLEKFQILLIYGLQVTKEIVKYM